MGIKELLEEFEKIYINECYEDTNKKCLALDEQEFAAIQLCLEILEDPLGNFDRNNYEVVKGLFITLKENPLKGLACDDVRVREKLLKFKMIRTTPNYDLETAPDVFWLYYALLLLYANEDATTEHGKTVYFERNYFRVYAYLACICPKVFCTLFFNEIFVFMKKQVRNGLLEY